MTLNEFYNEVARHADTDTQKITASDTRRVLATAFQVLGTLDTASLFGVIGKGLENARHKNAGNGRSKGHGTHKPAPAATAAPAAPAKPVMA
jgi:hypothetical protein